MGHNLTLSINKMEQQDANNNGGSHWTFPAPQNQMALPVPNLGQNSMSPGDEGSELLKSMMNLCLELKMQASDEIF